MMVRRSYALLIIAGTWSMLLRSEVYIDPIIAPQVQADLRQLATSLLTEQSPYRSAQEIKKHYPIISDLTIDQQRPGKQRIILNAGQPHACISDTVILDTTGKRYSPHSLAPEILKTVPTATVQRDRHHVLHELPADALTFLQKLNYDLLKDYAVEWKDNDNVLCRPRNTKNNVIIIASDTTVPTMQTMRRCEHLAATHSKKDTYRRNKPLILDTRFGGQIIAHQ